MISDTFHLGGLKVVVSPHIKPVPVIQIPHDFKWCSDEFRAKHNAWLRERFGTTEQMFRLADGTFVISENTYRALRYTYLSSPNYPDTPWPNVKPAGPHGIDSLLKEAYA